MHAGSAELSAYLRLQWQAALATFAQWPGAYSINGKVGATLPRMRQLEAASAADVPIPATCVASSSSVAAELLGVSVDNLIAKPIGDHLVEVVPGQVVGAFARRLNNESMLGHQEPAPILFQEYSPHAYELRVFLVGSQLLSFRVEKRSALELWSNPSDVDVQVCETPERVSQYIMGLNRVFSLDYGAFDFLATNGGEFIFLEVNIEGDWAYFESKAETDLVSDAVRRMLTDLFRSHA